MSATAPRSPGAARQRSSVWGTRFWWKRCTQTLTLNFFCSISGFRVRKRCINVLADIITSTQENRQAGMSTEEQSLSRPSPLGPSAVRACSQLPHSSSAGACSPSGLRLYWQFPSLAAALPPPPCTVLSLVCGHSKYKETQRPLETAPLNPRESGAGVAVTEAGTMEEQIIQQSRCKSHPCNTLTFVFVGLVLNEVVEQILSHG